MPHPRPQLRLMHVPRLASRTSLALPHARPPLGLMHVPRFASSTSPAWPHARPPLGLMHVPHLASTTFTALSHSCACRVSVSASCADHKGTKVKWPLWSAALTTRASRRDLTLVRRVRDESGYRLKQTRLDLGAPRSIRQHGPRLLLSFAFHGRRIFSLSCLYLFIVLSVSFHSPVCIFSLSFLYLFIVLSVSFHCPFCAQRGPRR